MVGSVPNTKWLSYINNDIILAQLSNYIRVEMPKYGTPLCLPHTCNRRHYLEVVLFKGENLCFNFLMGINDNISNGEVIF